MSENKKKKKRITLMYILGGGILKEDFIVNHTKMIILVVLLFFLYISNQYTCMIKIREIDKLQEQLKEVKYEAQSSSAQLTGNTRPSQVEELVKKQGLDLEKAKTPPYRLRK
jgi:cell division protein FtsL